MRFHLAPVRMVTIKKITNAGEDVEKKKQYRHYGNQNGDSSKS
jgi:hypothetical protein